MTERVEFPQCHCLVGVARGDITPPVGIYHRMWGAATHDRSTGVHRPLTATSLVLRNEANPQADYKVLIAVDHCLLWSKELNRLLDQISSTTGVDRNAIVVFFSHTHGAGLMGLERQELPGGDLIEPYLDTLEKAIARLVSESLQQLVPASIVFGTGDCSLAQNRDYHDQERNQYVCGFNPGGVTDSTVIVGRVSDETGKTMATIVNYACHPTSLAWDNTLISPDYVGAMREVIETATNAPCVFIQGASGDIGPREGFVGDTAVADRNGRQLGYASLEALESLPAAQTSFTYVGPVLSGATIGTWKSSPQSAAREKETKVWKSVVKSVPLGYRENLPRGEQLERERAELLANEHAAVKSGNHERIQQLRALVERNTRTFSRVGALPTGETFPFPLIAWRMGDVIWLALDGEHYNVLQRTLRKQFPEYTLIIGTIANGSQSWYLLDQPSFGLGLYQEEVSVLAKGSLEELINSASETIKGLIAH